MKALVRLLSLMLLGVAQVSMAQVAAGDGLKGDYFDGKNFEKLALTRIDKTIDFNWTIGPRGEGRWISPGPNVPGEQFSVHWTGYLYAPVTGVYTFQITTDDGMRVRVGGRKILNSWQNQAAAVYTAHQRLTAGRYYSLQVDYYQVEKDTRALLAWQLPNSTEAPQPIPTTNLYSAMPTSAVPILPKSARPQPAVAARSTTANNTPVVAAAPTTPPRKSILTPLKAALPTGRRPRAIAAQPKVASAPEPVTDEAASLPDMSALGKGDVVTLPNLYFTQSTATLLPTSRPVLNALARTLREQPALRMEIAGHTDNVGEAALNLRLSEQRARVVRQYLVQQGIDSVRLTARGYGGMRPVADNQDPKQRPRNRRVEVVVQ
ncbi:PA14 domain-containing protein [Hymenobacter jejuensis]|uniref:OmpA family protein n=1 Tax=Hymenobacter jejuensis TaxID=2502781 RepID=A0A5B7ZZM3_9BACT|nr:PA14 domain-containing protein [Hymenobacter jejuensis]QDA60317.1 hypothetical protein FHG12_09445 [Hymenobacter jejuensis]